MVKIKRIDTISLGKVLGSLYAVLGLIFGLVYGAIVAFFSLIGAGMMGSRMGMVLPFMFGGAVIVIFPILYGVIGFVLGCLVAVIYNFIAARFGGIVLETEQ